MIKKYKDKQIDELYKPSFLVEYVKIRMEHYKSDEVCLKFGKVNKATAQAFRDKFNVTRGICDWWGFKKKELVIINIF